MSLVSAHAVFRSFSSYLGDGKAIVIWAAFGDAHTAASLCRLSRSIRCWVMPSLYHTIILSTSAEIKALHDGLSTGKKSPHSYPPSFTFVLNLWIGPTSTRQEHDLFYASKAWSLIEIHGILTMCVNLRALALINVYPMLWPRVFIPATVTSITLGPIHARVHVRATDLDTLPTVDSTLNAPCRDRLGWEISHIGISPFLRCYYRFYPTITRALPQTATGFSSLPPIEPNLLELACCASSLDEAAQFLNRFARAQCPDPRLLVLRGRDDGAHDEVAFLHAGWIRGRE
ncbi:hypothetical protein VTO73DRAFT_14447 [Trametes versicolor]